MEIQWFLLPVETQACVTWEMLLSSLGFHFLEVIWGGWTDAFTSEYFSLFFPFCTRTVSGTVLSPWHIFSHFIFTITIWDRYYSYSPSSDKEPWTSRSWTKWLKVTQPVNGWNLDLNLVLLAPVHVIRLPQGSGQFWNQELWHLKLGKSYQPILPPQLGWRLPVCRSQSLPFAVKPSLWQCVTHTQAHSKCLLIEWILKTEVLSRDAPNPTGLGT